MVQRDPSPRGDKNGADINLALDALEMAFTHDHINAFAIVSGDSDFIALVNKLTQYDKRIFVVGRAYQHHPAEELPRVHQLRIAAGGRSRRESRREQSSQPNPSPAAIVISGSRSRSPYSRNEWDRRRIRDSRDNGYLTAGRLARPGTGDALVDRAPVLNAAKCGRSLAC
jgi:hypothetical protein